MKKKKLLRPPDRPYKPRKPELTTPEFITQTVGSALATSEEEDELGVIGLNFLKEYIHSGDDLHSFILLINGGYCNWDSDYHERGAISLSLYEAASVPNPDFPRAKEHYEKELKIYKKKLEKYKKEYSQYRKDMKVYNEAKKIEDVELKQLELEDLEKQIKALKKDLAKQ